MIYNNATVIENYSDNLEKAKICLKELDFCCNKHDVDFKGLTGWVFEQTILKCVIDELKNFNLKCDEIKEQFKLSSLKTQGNKCRGQVDLMIKINNNTYLIEIKHTGFFSKDDCKKYSKYKKIIEDNDFKYLYLTKYESYLEFKKMAEEVFGENNSFFLDVDGDWERFITLLVSK